MARLEIYTDIQSDKDKAVAQFWGDVAGVSFTDINQFCNALKPDDPSIDVHLKSDGGSVQEGWAIYDRLRATGKDIHTLAEGNVASMATIVMMAAPKGNRKAMPNAEFCIHNPCVCPYALGDALTADDLQRMADNLRAEQTKMANLYAERCGGDVETFQQLMNEDKFINTDEAISYGLIDAVELPLSASKTNYKFNTKMEKEVKVKQSWLDKVLAKLGVKSVQDVTFALTLNTADGGTLEVERESGDPQAGDAATPDGTFEMPDGSTIKVEKGVITEINPANNEGDGTEGDGDGKEGDKPPVDAKDEDAPKTEEQPSGDDDTKVAELEKKVDELEQRIAELESQLTDANAKAKTTEEMDILNLVAIAGGKKALAQLKSGYTPAKRIAEPKTTGDKKAGATKDAILARLAEMRKQ